MFKALQILALPIILATAFVGCETVKMDTSGSAKGYTTVSFVTEARPGFTPEETQADLMVRQAIADDFASHGIEGMQSGGELIVNYLIIVQDKATTTSLADYYGDSTADIISAAHSKRGSAGYLGRGAVVIDIIDAKTNKVIYRNYAHKTLLPHPTEEARRRNINSAVQQALAKFFR
ncbi:DUF4136 domain-containing protein [Rubellicoccus peritrichatus]|uniref:DUF4136 domain-containing protein n=1 Tax=Rubellicoccus peritrichatus TaxID=3080537 RepID=A0AAQ3QXE8_9BACT|nr:DUF4136 domain-containing protein [Puniceicoccus sp. CR14]WOO42992.1 DUF4136 domain-containing protein [Puniceicoccus sp. CR14]